MTCKACKSPSDNNEEDSIKKGMRFMCGRCGDWLNLNDGNECAYCKQLFCNHCVKEPYGICERCNEPIQDQKYTLQNEQYPFDSLDEAVLAAVDNGEDYSVPDDSTHVAVDADGEAYTYQLTLIHDDDTWSFDEHIKSGWERLAKLDPPTDFTKCIAKVYDGCVIDFRGL